MEGVIVSICNLKRTKSSTGDDLVCGGENVTLSRGSSSGPATDRFPVSQNQPAPARTLKDTVDKSGETI